MVLSLRFFLQAFVMCSNPIVKDLHVCLSQLSVYVVFIFMYCACANILIHIYIYGINESCAYMDTLLYVLTTMYVATRVQPLPVKY